LLASASRNSDASNESSPRWTCCWLPWICNRITAFRSGMRCSCRQRAQPVAVCSTARICRPGQGLATFSSSTPSRDSRARETPSTVHPPWSLLAIRSMRPTSSVCGVVRSAIFRGDADLKAGPRATTGLGGGALIYPQHDVSAEGAPISLPSGKAHGTQAMSTAVVTSKGQITIPADVRQVL
jgi:hypothetical protein